MPGSVEGGESVQAQQDTFETSYTVTSQEVELDVDFTSRKVRGRATIFIEPLSKNLEKVALACRSINVTGISVNSHTVKEIKYRDPYVGLKVRESYGVRQHLQMRENVEAAVQEHPEPNLIIEFPPQVRVRALDGNAILPGRLSAAEMVEAAYAANVEGGESMFEPIEIVVDYEVENSRDSLQWIGLRKGDSRYPHMYTKASSLPGSLPCFVFPYLGPSTAKYTWKLSITCPRTLGDLAWKPVELGDVMDVDEVEDEFLRRLTSEERNRDIIAIGSGVLEDNDVQCEYNDHRRKWTFSCSVAVAPVHIGFAIGPFEEVDCSEFRETGKEDQLKDHAVGVRGYCLPGRADELRNTCIPLQMAIDSFMQSYISYPWAPDCQTYKMCFVDDLSQDVVDTAALSLCSSRLLFPETIIDSVWENSRILIRAAASQWVGVFVTPKASSDYWIIIGASYFMADNFMAGLWGRNELRFRQKLAADMVKTRDQNMPSIYECGNAVALDPAELEFLELKAPLVLYLLHQRLIKQSSAVGVLRILTRMLSDARSGRLGSNEIWTDRFIYTTEKVAHAKVQSFFDQWIYGSGVPSFQINQAFQKKKFSVAITIKQTQRVEVANLQNSSLAPTNFFREVKEMEHDIYAGQLQEIFTGPMTIRVHEPSGMPYEQIVEIRDVETKVEFHYNSKNKNQLRKRRQRQKEAAAEGRTHVAEDGDDFVPTYSLGDILTSPEEMADWQLVNLDDDQERLLEGASYEWIRVDKDFEWIANTTFYSQGVPGELELMYIMQLQGDNDVVAHLEAIDRLQALNPTPLISSVFLRTLMDGRYFYGVRVMAARALVNCATPQLNYIGQFHLEKAFKTLFCYEGDTGMTKPNDFSDLRLYRIRCAIVQAMCNIRDAQRKAPTAVKFFYLDKLKFNDNSGNQYSDSYYVAFLISGLTKTLSFESNAFSFDIDDAADALERRLKREALGEIERMRRIDEWIPSYRNVHTRAALRGLADLMALRIIPKRTTSFLPYTRPGNHDEVRLEAFDHLINLGMMANDAFIRYLFSSLANEPSAYFRDRLWRRIHRGIASIALGDTALDQNASADVEMGGLVIEGGDREMQARNETAERSTVEGALKWMRLQLAGNKALQEAIMDALRSSIIGLKDFVELLDLCSYLYDTFDTLPVVLHYPKYWQVEHKGSGQLRFSRKDKFRLRPSPVIPSTSKRKEPPEDRVPSPDAKRPRTDAKVTLKLNNRVPSSSVSHDHFLPSPGPSQPSLSAPRHASPRPRESPLPQPSRPTPKANSPAPPLVSSKQSTPSVSRKPSYALPKPAPAVKPVAQHKRNILILKFRSRREQFAALVQRHAADGLHTTEAALPPAASTIPPTPRITNGANAIKAEQAAPAPPLFAIPTPNMESSRLAGGEAQPAKSSGFKLKLKMNSTT